MNQEDIKKLSEAVRKMKNDILMEEQLFQPRMFQDQMPPLVFPFGYMIISSTFMYYDDEEQDGNEEF